MWQELGQKFTTKARFGFQVLLNYTGGALIYIRREYASRIRIIQNSWRSANKKAAGITDVREVMAAPKKDKEKACGGGFRVGATLGREDRGGFRGRSGLGTGADD